MRKYYYIIISAICDKVEMLEETNQRIPITTTNAFGLRSRILEDIKNILRKKTLQLLKFVPQLTDQIHNKDFHIHNKDLIGGPKKKIWEKWVLFLGSFFCLVLFFFVYLSFFGSKRNLLDENSENILSLKIKTTTIGEEEKALMSEKDFLIIEIKANDDHKNIFLLLKKSGVEKDCIQYCAEKCCLFNFLFNYTGLSEKLNDYLITMPVEKVSGAFSLPENEYKLGFLDWENIQQIAENKYFFSENDWREYYQKELYEIKYENITKGIPSIPGIEQYFHNIVKFFYEISQKTIEEKKADLQSFVELFVESSPNFDEIENSINYSCELNTKKTGLTFVRGESFIHYNYQTQEVFNFLFEDEDFIKWFQKYYPKNIIKKEQNKFLYINTKIYDKIEEIAKERCLVSKQTLEDEDENSVDVYSILFFDENLGFKRIYDYQFCENFHEIQNLNPLIASQSYFQYFISQVFEKRKEKLEESSLKFIESSNWQDSLKEYFSTYPTKENIQKCLLENNNLCMYIADNDRLASRLSLFLNQFFNQIKEKNKIDLKINIMDKDPSEINDQQHDIIKRLQKNLEVCFYLYEEDAKEQKKKIYQCSNWRGDFESRIESLKINFNAEDTEEFWEYLMIEQEKKIAKGSEQIKAKKNNPHITTEEMEKIIPACFLTNLEQRYRLWSFKKAKQEAKKNLLFESTN